MIAHFWCNCNVIAITKTSGGSNCNVTVIEPE